MKKILDKWISISLIKRIIGGLAIGIILGILVPNATATRVCHLQIKNGACSVPFFSISMRFFL